MWLPAPSSWQQADRWWSGFWFSGRTSRTGYIRRVEMRQAETTMENTKPRVTIHMAASLDGFIARKDGSVDWLETSDHFEGGETLASEYVEEFLRTIDCYVMGSRTYETALAFEAKGLGWAYGDKPLFVLTSRTLRKRDTVE